MSTNSKGIKCSNWKVTSCDRYIKETYLPRLSSGRVAHFKTTMLLESMGYDTEESKNNLHKTLREVSYALDRGEAITEEQEEVLRKYVTNIIKLVKEQSNKDDLDQKKAAAGISVGQTALEHWKIVSGTIDVNYRQDLINEISSIFIAYADTKCKEKGYKIDLTLRPTLNYLKVLDDIYFKGESL